jgi:hypothetical protein
VVLDAPGAHSPKMKKKTISRMSEFDLLGIFQKYKGEFFAATSHLQDILSFGRFSAKFSFGRNIQYIIGAQKYIPLET